MQKSIRSLGTNRRLLGAVAVLLIGGAALLAVLGAREGKPAVPPRSEVRAPAHVLGTKLPPVQIKKLSSGDAVISLNSDVFFAFDSANLTRKARAELSGQVLDRILAVLERKSARVDLKGYTDGVGAAAYNLRLSRERADAVHAFLVAAGAPAGRSGTEGFGEKLATSPQPDQDLRRVDVVLHDGGSQ